MRGDHDAHETLLPRHDSLFLFPAATIMHRRQEKDLYTHMRGMEPSLFERHRADREQQDHTTVVGHLLLCIVLYPREGGKPQARWTLVRCKKVRSKKVRCAPPLETRVKYVEKPPGRLRGGLRRRLLWP